MRFPQSLALLAACMASITPASAQNLSGVSDRETTISLAGRGGVRQYEIGAGDVMFVRDRTNRWFRIQLNRGCLGGTRGLAAASFVMDSDQRIDRLTRVNLFSPRRTCLIDSIRRSAPPPQVDSRSPNRGR